MNGSVKAGRRARSGPNAELAEGREGRTKERRNSATGDRRKKRRQSNNSRAPTTQPSAESSEAVNRPSGNGRLTNAVVKIFTTHCEPNFAVPWTTKGQESSISSGFAFDVRGCLSLPDGVQNQRLLLTNAHCVEHAAVVQLRRRGSAVRYVARILAVANDCDLALMTVDDETFWDGMEYLELVAGSDPPAPGQTLTIVGFPTGGENTCVTQGVVSRLDYYDYAQGGKEFLAIQVDAAINGGNSGGPALNKKGKCVGIAFQSNNEEDVENQGQIIPTEIVLHFLADFFRNGKYTGFPHPGFDVQELESAPLRQYLGLQKHQSGVRVRSVELTSPAHDVIKVGDIVTGMDSHDVGNDGNASYRFGERLPMQYLFQRKFVGDSIAISLIRDGAKLDLSLRLEEEKALVPVTVSEIPQYYIAGGLVFVVLSEPFLKHEFGDDFSEDAPPALLAAWESGRKHHATQEMVILTRVLAHG
eukprot:1913693-Rhodomonas_salina.1